MELMESRRLITLAPNNCAPVPPTPVIGGLPVFLDNSRYTGANGSVDEVVSDNEYFLTGIIDTGTTASKQYTATRIGASTAASLRMFNDLTAQSVDYWTLMRSDLLPGRIVSYSFNSSGRYIIISVSKEYAANFYLKDANGDYLVKGENVT